MGDPLVSAVYALVGGGRIYLGKTIEPKTRLRVHLATKSQSARGHWIRSLVASGTPPTMVILELVSGAAWAEAESYWISFFRGLGADVVNTSHGGDGRPPGSRSKSVIRKPVAPLVRIRRRAA